MRKKKGFVDKGLYGLKDKLKKTSEEFQEPQPIQSTPEEEISIIEETIEDNTSPEVEIPKPTPERIEANPQKNEPTPKVQKVVEIDKELKKTLQGRKAEYLRTKKHVVQKVTSTLSKLPIKMSDLERELKDLTATEKKIKETISEINTINEKDWHSDDFSSQLGEAAKTVENARLQHLMLCSKLTTLEENSPGKIKTTSDNSIIPELTSLKFFQLFRLGLGFTLPLIIGSIITGIIISLTIFFVMGGF
jgi:hypothetical protein